MAAIIKRGDQWLVIYRLSGGRKRFVNTRIPHSPVGTTCNETRTQRVENERAAHQLAAQLEQLTSQSGKQNK